MNIDKEESKIIINKLTEINKTLSAVTKTASKMYAECKAISFVLFVDKELEISDTSKNQI